MCAFRVPCASPGRLHYALRHNPPREVYSSKPFTFRNFRTLCTQWTFATPLPSAICALFPVQWRRRVCSFYANSCGSHAFPSAFCTFYCKLDPLFSISCRMPLPQPLSFHIFALLPGVGGGAILRGVKVILELMVQRRMT